MSGPTPKSPILDKAEQVLWDCWNTAQHALDVVATVVVSTVTLTPAYTAPVQSLVTVAAHGTPVALGAAHTYFQTLTLIGNKDQARTQNVGNLFFGPSGAAGTQAIIIARGTSYTLIAPIGQKYDLHDWMIDAATDGDGAVIIYS